MQEITTLQKNKYFKNPKDYIMLLVGIFATLYLINFGFGIIEILPDTLPFIGNVDEVLVTGVLISVLEYFDINITQWFKRS